MMIIIRQKIIVLPYKTHKHFNSSTKDVDIDVVVLQNIYLLWYREQLMFIYRLIRKSLTPLLFIEVSVPWQKCICVLGV
jgi:hypothetical protein